MLPFYVKLNTVYTVYVKCVINHICCEINIIWYVNICRILSTICCSQWSIRCKIYGTKTTYSWSLYMLTIWHICAYCFNIYGAIATYIIYPTEHICYTNSTYMLALFQNIWYESDIFLIIIYVNYVMIYVLISSTYMSQWQHISSIRAEHICWIDCCNMFNGTAYMLLEYHIFCSSITTYMLTCNKYMLTQYVVFAQYMSLLYVGRYMIHLVRICWSLYVEHIWYNRRTYMIHLVEICFGRYMLHFDPGDGAPDYWMCGCENLWFMVGQWITFRGDVSTVLAADLHQRC